MMEMRISGLGIAGAFGCGTRELRAALEHGGVKPSFCADAGAQSIPVYRASTTALERYLNKRVLRRIDHFSRLALLGAFEALEDGEYNFDFIPARERLGVVLCSGFGALSTTFRFLDSVMDDGDSFASPTAFSNSVHNAAAAHISMQLGITGPGQTLSQFDHSFISGVQQAQMWLEEKRVDAVLLGTVDEYCSVLGYCWERFLGIKPSTQMRPFASDSSSALPGEGAAFFLLRPQQDGSAGYARISGMECGHVRGSSPRLGSGAPLILGCEGYPDTMNMYREHLPADAAVACYTPLYGASPVAPAFDVAIAALALERGKAYPAPAAPPAETGWATLSSGSAVETLTCVDFGVGGEYSALHRARPCL
ncbi:MAG: beta-ketoacyl synthase chain length factor [Geobacteraceae bacterium]|nr:beta-ketoacyl synthase chain length factor [Geobacteraceae bacterium]